MAVPAWTTREWRPLARELCAQLAPARPVSSRDASTASRGSETSDQKAQQRLLLHADKVVAKLYGHRYMDTTPQQIKGEVEEIANKMDLHMLSARAARLRTLAAGCDYRVVKMLLELADAPTSASDAKVAVDSAMPLEALQAWNRLLTPSKEVQKAEEKARQEAALAAKMETELLNVAWEDDWWKERLDDDVSELEDALDMDSDVGDEGMSELGDEGGFIRGIASRVLEADSQNEDGDVDIHSAAKEDADGSPADTFDDEEDEDRLLLQYFDPAVDPRDRMDTEDSHSARQGSFDEDKRDSAFSFEVPSMLLSHVERVIMSRPNNQSAGLQSREPRRVVNEEVLVEAAFYALRGVPSPFFNTSATSQTYFKGELSTSDFALSTLATRGIGISHLSPMAMVGALEKVALAASHLENLREVSAFLSKSSVEEWRSTVAEGVAYELQQLLNECGRFISEIYESMVTARVQVDHGDTESSPKLVLPTLLSAKGAFQEMFTMLSWLKSTIVKCFDPFQLHSRNEITAAQLSSRLLSVLHQELQVEFVESLSSAASDNSRWDSYAILWRLFSGALVPYLDAIDHMLFERGYDARIELHHELFFVASGRSFSSPLSPRSSAQRQNEESFEDVMSALMPFRVETTSVPSFLRPLVRLLCTALESRQILNQYMSQHGQTESSKNMSSRLSDQFMVMVSNISSAPAPPSGAFSSTPFDEIIREALIQPIKDKCLRMNGSIASLFREKLQFREHMDTVRLFLLMQQQDVFTNLVQFIIEQIQLDPVGWAKNESLNAAFQESIQRLQTEGLISADQREIAARINIRVDTKELEKLRVTRHVDVMAVRHLHFRFDTAQPLRVLFSASVVQKYSKLAILLLQVKLVELILTNFKQRYRHRLCFLQTQDTLRPQLVHLADMLHYTRAVLNYLANQMTGDAWSQVDILVQQSQSIRDINDAHEAYLDKMLNAFFVLKKHEGFTRQFMQNFNDVIAYSNRVDEFVRTVERNMAQVFDTVKETSNETTTGRISSRRDNGTRRQKLVPNDEFRALYSKLQRSLTNSEGNYENQLHVITIVLDAMVKNGASPHVNELLLLLTFNGFRASSRSRLPTSR